MADAHANFAYSQVFDAPSPASSGTSLTVQDGTGRDFPTVPFNATVWPTGVQPLSTNAEIIRVTNLVDGVMTIERAQEGTSARSILVGDQIAATITAKTLTDMETPLTYYEPFKLAAAGSGLQTYGANYTTVVGTNSLFVFPVTIPEDMQFNQVLVVNSLSYVTSAIAAASNSYYSKFGLYTMNANTLSLISSNSFSIGESINSVSMTWNYPTSTATSGYGYGSFPAGNLTTTAQMASYISGTRMIGLQFGGNISTLTGGQYWMGLLSLKSTANTRSTYGLSNAGIFGQPIPNFNQVGTVSGLRPIGYANSAFSGTNASHLTQWWGKQIIGFVTATSITNQLGTAVPDAIELSALAGFAANSTATILPVMTFVST